MKLSAVKPINNWHNVIQSLNDDIAALKRERRADQRLIKATKDAAKLTNHSNSYILATIRTAIAAHDKATKEKS